MFSSFSSRGRLRKSMSSRSIRRPRPPTEALDPGVAKLHAAAAASHAMQSSQQTCPQLSAELKCSYIRVGGPAQVAIPRRRPKSSLQYTDDSASTNGAPTVPPSTPLPSSTAESIFTVNDPEYSAILPSPAELNDSPIPPSYRRLRKAKSMFSTRQRSSHISYSTPPLPHRDAMDIERGPRFALPRTMRNTPFFHRESPLEGTRAVRHAKSQDTAIQLARSQFLEDYNGTEPQSRRSSLFMYRRRKENRPFRKTFRTTSESSIGAKTPGEESHSRRRTFSASFKNGLKRVFGLSKPIEQRSKSPLDEDPVASPVPITIDEGNVKSAIGECVGICGDANNEEGEMNNDTQPSPLHVPQISPSRASLCTSRSRVTSWADSTVANTITTRKPGYQQSLSLIEEHGDLNQQLPHHPYEAAEQPSSAPGKSAVRRFNDWVDSHDLYSALMQQIGRQAGQNTEEEIVFGTVPEHRAIPARASSVLSRRSKYTIRRVPSGDSSTPGSFTTARAGDSSSPRKHVIRPLQYIPSPTISPAVPEPENQYLAPLDEKSSLSPYARGGGSDDETGSVIVARYEGSRMGAISPSVYSRTTNGGTPTEDDIESPSLVDEPGTATIYASQRAVYKSPTRSSSSSPLKAQVKPSLEWQQWMSSQIEKIETASPTREHVREAAQFQDDDDDDEIFMGMMRRAPGGGQESTTVPYISSEPKQNDLETIEALNISSQNNFSRPFSRSSSVRTILPSQYIEPSSTVKKASKLSAVEASTDALLPPCQVPSDRTLSPMRTRVTNLPELPDSPTPQRAVVPDLSKRNLTKEQYRRYSARRPLANGKLTSFRSMRAYRDFNALNDENWWQKEEHDSMMDEYHKKQDGHSTISSKHMVEMFLNSRRQPAEPVLDGNARRGEAFI